MDIEALQRQLRSAIQNHQVLVAKMKTEPQNTALQKQLRELQSQITLLSEKQKTYVQQLRKELVHPGSSGILLAKSEGVKISSIQTIGMQPGVRYSLRAAPGGGMTLMPTPGVTPIPATLSLAPSNETTAGAPVSGVQATLPLGSLVNPSLQSPSSSVLTFSPQIRPVTITTPLSTQGMSSVAPAVVVGRAATSGATLRASALQLSQPLVITSSPSKAVLIKSNAATTTTTTKVLNCGVGIASTPQPCLVNVQSQKPIASTPLVSSPVPATHLALILPKQKGLSAGPTSSLSSSIAANASGVPGASNVPSTPRSFSPLIKIPQFCANRPNILQPKAASTADPAPATGTDAISASLGAAISATLSVVKPSATKEASVDERTAPPSPDGNAFASSSAPPTPSKSGLESPLKKKRKSPHALIREDPLAHVESTTQIRFPKNRSASKLDFVTSTSKVPMTVLNPPSPLVSSSPPSPFPPSPVDPPNLAASPDANEDRRKTEVDDEDKEEDDTTASVVGKNKSQSGNMLETKLPAKASPSKKPEVGKKSEKTRKEKTRNENQDRAKGKAKTETPSTPVDREKVEFMNALDLVLPSVLKELQNKRSERKRRSTANPHFSYPGGNNSAWGDLSASNSKRARLHQAMLAAATAAAAEAATAAATESAEAVAATSSPDRTKTKSVQKRKSMMAGDRHIRDEEDDDSRPESPDSDVSNVSAPSCGKNGSQIPAPDFHEDACNSCTSSSPPLFPCSACSLVFHPACLRPPLATDAPPADWRCPQCRGGSPKPLNGKKKKGKRKSKMAEEEKKESAAAPEAAAAANLASSLLQSASDVAEGVDVKPKLEPEMEKPEATTTGATPAESPNYSATLNMMHSYIASKSSKEEEKRKLQRRNAELKAEREQLETKSQQLKANMQVQNNQHDLLVSAHERIQEQVEKLKNFLKLFQNY